MAAFPKSYQIVRQGAATSVTVNSDEDVIALRTELELLFSFTRGATPEVVDALETRLAILKSGATGQGGRAAGDVEDMLAILRDAMSPVTAAAIAQIDTDFPQARREIDMAAVEKESSGFREDVGREIAASGKPAAERLSQVFKQALLKSAMASKRAAEQTPQAAAGTGAAVNNPPGNTEAAPNRPNQAESASPAGTATAETPPPEPEVDPVEAALKEAVEVAQEAIEAEAAMEAQESVDTPAALEAEEVADEVDGSEELPVEEALVVEDDQDMGSDQAIEAESLAEMAGLAGESGGQDAVGAALAEAIEGAGQPGEEAGAPISESPEEAQAAGVTDPVDTILLEQAAPGQSETAPADALEQIMAEQEAADNNLSLEDLADMLLGDQADETVLTEEVDDLVKEQLPAGVAARQAAQSEPEDTVVKAAPKSAGDQVEGSKANADSDTVMVPQDDASRPDVAAQDVAQAIEATRSEIDAIATAFEEATADLAAMENEVSAVAGQADEWARPEADQGDAMKPMTDVSKQFEGPPGGADTGPTAASTANPPSLNLREELHAIRQSLHGELERLVALLDRVDQAQVEAENLVARARNYHQAAQRAEQLGRSLVEARGDAAEARAAYEGAQRRLEEVESAWQAARRAADDAAF